MEKHSISIWFFIGLILVLYGILIFGASVYNLFVPPAHPVVLYRLHSGVWWGALLIVMGAVYLWKFSPRKKKD